MSAALIIAIVEKYSTKPVGLDSAIFHDLGIFGLDAWELFSDISEALPVNFEGFDFKAHFPNESDLFPNYRKQHRPRITIRDLCNFVASGKTWQAFKMDEATMTSNQPA
ncbi:DUF1493 family protein [Hyphobacterium sp.]|uniref:DUF1493 family protein n=1 Tax=Hyphobacterium sp. TaxID=2004662 RepID=UPI003BAC978E